LSFLKKFLKNKVLVVSICVIVVSLVYKGIQNAIDRYNFKSNNDIIVEEEDVIFDVGETENSNDFGEGTQGETIENSENFENPAESEGEISSEETDLVLEETFREDVENESDSAVEIDGEKSAQNKIYVYITGEVNAPGVVVLNEGSRIVDAINAAGGTTANADISKVNLVYILEDGMKVNIPNINDLKNNSDFEYITMNSGDGGNNDYETGGNSENNVGASVSSSSEGYSKKYDIVNINSATQTELETLPGIGPSLALKIINYRKENGKFSSIEQIKDVSGIGDAKFENLKNYITI